MRYLLLLLALIPSTSTADPLVTVTPLLHKNFSRILFTIEQERVEEMEGCHYNLFAADREQDLYELPLGARSIATFTSIEEQIHIVTVDIKRLKRKKKKFKKMFFRMLMPCPERGVSFTGDIVSLKIRTSKRGKFRTVDKATLWIKNHIRYATEADLEEAGL